jgi:hypothetical protein
LSNVFNINFSGNAAFTGIIYAPEAYVTFGGSGNGNYDIVGAVYSLGLGFNGHASFHYDENLARNTSLLIWLSTLTSRTVQPGTNITFSVFVGGGAATSCNWYFNQTNLLSAGTGTNTSLTMTNVQFTNAGSYTVVASNSFGCVTSAPASLIVYTDATPTMCSSGLSTNGQFQFNLGGVTGLNYAVQVSSNMVNWDTLATNTSPFIFTDTNLNQPPPRFYRAVFVP